MTMLGTAESPSRRQIKVHVDDDSTTLASDPLRRVNSRCAYKYIVSLTLSQDARQLQ